MKKKHQTNKTAVTKKIKNKINTKKTKQIKTMIKIPARYDKKIA